MLKKMKMPIIMILLMTLILNVNSVVYADVQEFTVYENTFDNGAKSVTAVSNDFMSFDGVRGVSLQNSEINGNMGVRIRQDSWLYGQTFLFDFTKNQTKAPLRSGIITISFDFSMDSESPADYAIIGANMSKTYEGDRMVYFMKGSKCDILSARKEWQSSSNAKSLDASKIYNMKIVINLDEGKAEYYLDNTLSETQTNWYGIMVENLSVSLSGLLDYFDNFKVTARYPFAIENEVRSEKPGNIFYEEEPMLLNLIVTNQSAEALQENINLKIKDAHGESVWSDSFNITVEGRSSLSVPVTPELPLFGTYFMTVTSPNAQEFTTRISRSVRASSLNKKSGVVAHFDGRHPMDVPTMFDIMSNAGFGTVRTDWGWRLNSDGSVYDYENTGIFKETIAEANEHGIDILALLGVANDQFIDLDTDGGLNTAPEALDAYKSFCRTVTSKLKGKVNWFEIGNENNFTKRYATQEDVEINTIVLSNGRTLIDDTYVYSYSDDYSTYERNLKTFCDISISNVTDDSGTYSVANISTKGILGYGAKVLHENTKAYVFETGENYAKLLKAAYEGIKEGNPDAVVTTSGSSIGFTDPIGTENRNMQEFVNGLLGAMKSENDYYFDVLATHPYHVSQPPEVIDQWIMDQNWSMQAAVGNQLLEKHSAPSDKKLWATEFGYSVADSEDDSSAAMLKSAWIIRTMLMNEIGGYHEKMYLYDILNDGLDETDAEHNYGIVCYCKDEVWNKVTAYAAKPQYLAMAQYNKMLADAVYTENINVTETIYKAYFQKENGDEIYVLWDVENSGQTVTVEGTHNKVKVYDIFGNVLKEADSATVDVNVGEYPVYVEFQNHKDIEITVSGQIVQARIENNGKEDISPVLIVATYTKVENKLEYCRIGKEYTISQKQADKISPGEIAYIKLDNIPEAFKRKIFLFDGLDTLRPLVSAIER